ncbi:MAG: exodeoxyribonuclease VII large subunit [bacterium]
MSTQEKVYTVTELNNRSKVLLEGQFKNILLDGEISNFKKYGSGHLYFSLKDSSAQISAVMYKFKTSALKFEPRDGMSVRARGTITIYPARGSYQIIVNLMAVKGAGELQRKFEELKEKLEKEGLFDKARKREIPVLPRKIGVVTSPSGAAIRDILTVLKRRFSNVHVLLYPVRVQGASAKGEIVRAIESFNADFSDVDVLIVGRGGGSLEDLWAFNEEEVARAVFASRIPVISAVGHEVDWVISDFVADKRAATPSVAAEIVLSRKSEFMHTVDVSLARMRVSLTNRFRSMQNRVEIICERPYFRNPALFLSRYEQAFDLEMQDFLKAREKIFLSFENNIEKAATRLNILSPRNTLSRGYSISTGLNGAVIKDKNAVSDGERIKVTFYKGAVNCEVQEHI